MNFDEAIRSHTTWKLKLSVYLDKPDGSLRVDQAGREDLCDLGKWIGGEGRARYAALDEFAKLDEQHRLFHRAVADVVARADTGNNVSEEIALGAKSNYAVASNAIVTALMRMKQKLTPPA